MRYLFIFLSVFMLFSPLLAQTAPSRSQIAAVVNKSAITERALLYRLRLAAINAGMEPSPANLDKLKPQMLRAMIDETLQLQAAQKFDITVSDEEVKEAISQLERSSNTAPGHIARVMAENKIPLSVLEDQIRANRMWITLIRAKYTPTLQITKWEVDQALKLEKEKSEKPQFHLAEIVLLFEGPQQEERVKADLNRLMEELQKGAHFSVLAQQFSQSPTAGLGGDMGWVTEDELPPEVQAALSSMEPGQLSKPIRTPHSYTLIGYIEKKPPITEGQTLISMQQILFPFPPQVTEAEVISIMTLAEKVARESKSCSELEARAKKAIPSSQPRFQEGILESIPEALQKIIGELPVNKASQPMLTEQGGILIMVCSKKKEKPQPITEEAVKANLMESKLQRFADRELRDYKRSAYIEFRKASSTPVQK